jgi:pimeloyl-ACP methyl ester carboxylesterase
MDRGAAFRKAARHLRDLDVVLYDRRGYARSLDAGTAATVDALVGDLVTVIDGKPTPVVGHSLGGLVALAAAARHPDLVTAVGAFEAPMGWQPWWPASSAGGAARAVATAEGPDAAAERFMRRLIGEERWEGLPSGTRAQRRAEGPALLADLDAMRDGPPFDPRQVHAPAVVGHGTETSDRHRRASVEMAAALPGAELWTIEGAGHHAPDTHPAEFARFVRRTVDRAPAI